MFPVRQDQLPNGLRIVHVARPHLHRAVIGVFADVGSRYETARTNGISHFLEHMLFRGTRRLPSAQALNHAIESLGGTLTAATHADYTRFEIMSPPDALPDAAVILGDMMRRPVFDGLAVERGIVREEILEDLDDEHVECNLDNLSRRQVFGRHPLGMKITGTLENLDRFTVPMLRSYMRRHYRAGNMVVCVCSPFSSERTFAAIARGFRGLPPGGPRLPHPFAITQSRARIEMAPNGGAQTGVRIAFPTPGSEVSAGAASEMLMRVLDDGMSTRLHRRVCDELGLAYGITANVELFRDAGVFEINANVAHDALPTLVNEILGVLATLVEDGLTERELDKVKRRALFDLDAMNDDAHTLTDFFGAAALAGRPLDIRVRRRRIASLTREDMRRAARMVFAPHRLNLITSGEDGRAARRGIERAVRRFRDRLAHPRYDVAIPISPFARRDASPDIIVRAAAALDARIRRS